jgi:CRISPR-associated protein Cas1
MLSLGYTFLANAVASAVNIVGLDPYLGSLHQPDYGRPSLVLDLMEEFRPVIVDALVLRLINKKTMTLRDFYFQTEAVPVPDGEERENLAEEDYPVLMTHEGMKKFILYFEQVLNARTTYPRYGVQLSYRNIILEQARLLVRHLKSEEDYASFSMR